MWGIQIRKIMVVYATNSSLVTCLVPESGLMSSRKVSKRISVMTKSNATLTLTWTLCKKLSGLEQCLRSVRMPGKAAELSWPASMQGIPQLKTTRRMHSLTPKYEESNQVVIHSILSTGFVCVQRKKADTWLGSLHVTGLQCLKKKLKEEAQRKSQSQNQVMVYSFTVSQLQTHMLLKGGYFLKRHQALLKNSLSNCTSQRHQTAASCFLATSSTGRFADGLMNMKLFTMEQKTWR